MSAESAPRPSRPLWPWLLLPALALAGAWAWHAREAALDRQRAALAGLQQTLDALQARQATLRADQRAQAQRLQQADATNRVLREEVLGVGQRAALLEDSVARLADPARRGVEALRLDEAELLLDLGLQRLQLAGDLDGARRAYALAAGVLAAVDDPAYLDLRQTLAQERAALDALGVEPRARALAALAAFGRTLDAAAAAATPAPTTAAGPWWRRMLDPVVRVRPSRAGPALPADRAALQATAQLELSLARAAAERRDVEAYRAALARALPPLARLGAPPERLRHWRTQLQALAAMPLSPPLPTLGSTLAQLRQRRGPH